ncbi:MAG: hypothetical protein IMZ53_09140 [Thermoplasmata archaeon]|nr:hypothetical protein [Thermoplasmata archaeon]
MAKTILDSGGALKTKLKAYTRYNGNKPVKKTIKEIIILILPRPTFIAIKKYSVRLNFGKNISDFTSYIRTILDFN